MTSPFPQLQTLIGFGNGPLDDNSSWTVGNGVASGQWTDISAYVSDYTVNKGRQHELGAFEAGTVSLKLNNVDQRFTPWYGAGPYANLIQPQKQIQIRSIVNGVTYYVFTGHVTAWIPQWPDPRSQFAQVEAADAFRLLQATLLVNSNYQNQVIADGATQYWKLSDGVGSLTAASQTGGVVGVVHNVGQSVIFGETGPLLLSPDTGANFGQFVSAGNSDYIAVTGGGVSGGSGFTIEGWIKVTNNGGYLAAQNFDNAAAGNAFFIALATQSGVGICEFTIYNTAGAGSLVQGTRQIVDGQWHHIVLSYAGGTNGAVTLYVDGTADVSSTVTGTTNMSSADPCFIGAGDSGAANQAPSGVSLAQIAFYPSALSPTQVLNHYNLAIGFPQQQSGSYVQSVLAAINWPTALENIDTGDQTCQANATNLAGTTALTLLQTIVQTEGGALYMDGRGRVRFISRTNLYVNGPTFNNIQAWFGDQINYGFTTGAVWGTSTWGGQDTWGHAKTAQWGDTNAWDNEAWGTNDLPYEPSPDLALDDLDLINQVTVGRVNGVAQTVNDTGSQTGFGLHSTSETGLLHLTDYGSLEHATWLLNKLKTPVTRLRQIHINLLDDATNLPPAVLGLDLLYRVSVERAEVGFTQIALVEHISHHITVDSWEVTLSLSPTDVLANTAITTEADWIGGQ